MTRKDHFLAIETEESVGNKEQPIKLIIDIPCSSLVWSKGQSSILTPSNYCKFTLFTSPINGG